MSTRTHNNTPATRGNQPFSNGGKQNLYTPNDRENKAKDGPHKRTIRNGFSHYIIFPLSILVPNAPPLHLVLFPFEFSSPGIAIPGHSPRPASAFFCHPRFAFRRYSQNLNFA